MKTKTKIIILVGVMLAVITTPVFAKQGSFEDANVKYIYWDESSTTFWTGVTNKINYNRYAPCVGPKKYSQDEIYCGFFANQNVYKEKSGQLYNGHSHSLLSDYGTYDYWEE